MLRIAARSAASSVATRLHAPAEGMRIAWRWKVDRVVDAGQLESRTGDDYAARAAAAARALRDELNAALGR